MLPISFFLMDAGSFYFPTFQILPHVLVNSAGQPAGQPAIQPASQPAGAAGAAAAGAAGAAGVIMRSGRTRMIK